MSATMTEADADVVGWLVVRHADNRRTTWAFDLEDQFDEARQLLHKHGIPHRAHHHPRPGIVEASAGINDAWEVEHCLKERGEIT